MGDVLFRDQNPAIWDTLFMFEKDGFVEFDPEASGSNWIWTDKSQELDMRPGIKPWEYAEKILGTN